MAKQVRQRYDGERKPKSYRLAHNHITHTPEFLNGANGFRRFWIPPQWVGKGWSKCPCGWWPELGVHYAHRDHVDWWQSEIKKRGSLKAVHHHIRRRLRATGDMPLADSAEIEAEIEAWLKALAAAGHGHGDETAAAGAGDNAAARGAVAGIFIHRSAGIGGQTS